jgi:hypothetical protein
MTHQDEELRQTLRLMGLSFPPSRNCCLRGNSFAAELFLCADGVGNPAAPSGNTGRTRPDLPRSWENPHAAMPGSQTPVGPLHQATTV